MFWIHTVTCCTCKMLLSQKTAKSRRFNNFSAVGRCLPLRGGCQNNCKKLSTTDSACPFYQFLCQTGRQNSQDSGEDAFFRDGRKITFLRKHAQKQWLQWCEHRGLPWCSHHGSHLSWTLLQEMMAAAIISSVLCLCCFVNHGSNIIYLSQLFQLPKWHNWLTGFWLQC